MTHSEKCQACEDSFKAHKVEALKKTSEEAHRVYTEANIAYLEAREAYHKFYREVWYPELCCTTT